MEFTSPVPTWNDFPEAGRDLFRVFREPETGRKLLIEQNVFIEKVLPGPKGNLMEEGTGVLTGAVEQNSGSYLTADLLIQRSERLYCVPIPTRAD
jgi:hypothetical protein